MTDETTRHAMDDTISYLETLARDGTRPHEAMTRLGALRAKHPGLTVDLVWEASAYPNTVHYDALLRSAGGDTVTVSLCAGSDTPWPLRGVRLASDHDLLRVNGETLKVRDAIDCIDFLLDEARIVRPLVDLCIVEEACKRLVTVPTATHVQRAVDAFRTARGLTSASQTLAWMAANDLTHERLERLVEGQARAYALRDHVVSEPAAVAYWHAHPGAFDVAHLARLRVRTREHAGALAAAIHGGRDFYRVLEEELVARRLVALPRGPLQRLRRRDLARDVSAAIFAAAPGDVIGPLEGEQGLDLLRIIGTETADFDDPSTREALSAALFDEWLAEQRQSARVEWFWGPADGA